jgi:ABC-type polysaccharide/polyol phosphate export permease
MIATIKSIISHVPVIKEMMIMDRHENSFLTRFGLLEVVMSTLAGIAWWGILYWMRFLRFEGLGAPYIAYILIGTQVWAYGMAIHNGVASIYQRYKMIMWQWRMPVEVFCAYQFIIVSLRYAVMIGVSMLLLQFVGIPFQVKNFAFIFLTIPLILFFMMTGLCASVFSVVNNKSLRISQAIFGILFIVTPIVYPLKSVHDPLLRLVLNANPLTHLIGSCRDWLLFGHMESWRLYVTVALVVVIGFVLLLNCFKTVQHTIIERLYL